MNNLKDIRKNLRPLLKKAWPLWLLLAIACFGAFIYTLIVKNTGDPAHYMSIYFQVVAIAILLAKLDNNIKTFSGKYTPELFYDYLSDIISAIKESKSSSFSANATMPAMDGYGLITKIHKSKTNYIEDRLKAAEENLDEMRNVYGMLFDEIRKGDMKVLEKIKEVEQKIHDAESSLKNEIKQVAIGSRWLDFHALLWMFIGIAFSTI